MRDNYPPCLAITLKHEGGKSMRRDDPGNWTGGKPGVGELKGTNLGIAANAHPHLDIMALTAETVAPIYRAEYSDMIRDDGLPAGVDLASFDYVVNSGPGRVWPMVKAARANGLSPVAFIEDITSRRMAFLHRLKTFGTFGKGWSSRVADIHARALKMAYTAANGAVPVAKKLSDKAASHVEAAKDKAKGAVVTGAGSGGSVADASQSVPHAPTWALWALGLALAAIAGGLLWYRFQDLQLAKALEAVAKEP